VQTLLMTTRGLQAQAKTMTVVGVIGAAVDAAV